MPRSQNPNWNKLLNTKCNFNEISCYNPAVGRFLCLTLNLHPGIKFPWIARVLIFITGHTFPKFFLNTTEQGREAETGQLLHLTKKVNHSRAAHAASYKTFLFFSAPTCWCSPVTDLLRSEITGAAGRVTPPLIGQGRDILGADWPRLTLAS